MTEWQTGDAVLRLVQGDITKVETDAMGNAANAQLAGGGGVDGAIHRAGGGAIMADLRRRYPTGCPTGQAVATVAGRLPAQWVIHAVAPVYLDGRHGEPSLLRSAYRAAIAQAEQLGARRLTLPSLGTGIYGNPLDASALIAVEAALEHLRGGRLPTTITFVLFDPSTLAAFRNALTELAG